MVYGSLPWLMLLASLSSLDTWYKPKIQLESAASHGWILSHINSRIIQLFAAFRLLLGLQTLAQPQKGEGEGGGGNGGALAPPTPQDERKKNGSKSKNEKIIVKFYSPGKLEFCWPINMDKLEIIFIIMINKFLLNQLFYMI